MSPTLPPLAPTSASNSRGSLPSMSKPPLATPSPLRASAVAPTSPPTASITPSARSPSSSFTSSTSFAPSTSPSNAVGFPFVSESLHDPDFEQMSVDHILQDLLAERKVTPRLVSECSEQQLLLIFPLILNTIQNHPPTEPSPLLRPLLMRLCSSRRLKLRFLLLRKHPAFLQLRSTLSFVSQGYNRWCFARGCTPSSSNGVLHKQCDSDNSTFRVPVDMVDLQSEDFFRNIVFEQPRKDKYDFGFQLISHPFRVQNLPHESSFNGPDEEELSYLSSQSDNTEDYYPDQQLAESATVRVEVDHTAIELRHLSFEEEVVKHSNMIPLLPRLIIRKGTNMLKMQLCQMLFVFFNCVWSTPTPKYPDVHSAPICVTFDVIASGLDQGLMRAFCHVQSFSNFRFDFWQDTRGRDPVVADEFVRSAAGAFTAAYICGVNTQPKDTFCVKDGAAFYLHVFDDMFHGPPQPKVGVPKTMRRCLLDIGVWDDFHSCCMRAFHSLREKYLDIFSIMSPLFAALCNMDEKSISDHLSSKHCFNLRERNARKAVNNFRKWLG